MSSVPAALREALEQWELRCSDAVDLTWPEWDDLIATVFDVLGPVEAVKASEVSPLLATIREHANGEIHDFEALADTLICVDRVEAAFIQLEQAGARGDERGALRDGYDGIRVNARARAIEECAQVAGMRAAELRGRAQFYAEEDAEVMRMRCESAYGTADEIAAQIRALLPEAPRAGTTEEP